MTLFDRLVYEMARLRQSAEEYARAGGLTALASARRGTWEYHLLRDLAREAEIWRILTTSPDAPWQKHAQVDPQIAALRQVEQKAAPILAEWGGWDSADDLAMFIFKRFGGSSEQSRGGVESVDIAHQVREALLRRFYFPIYTLPDKYARAAEILSFIDEEIARANAALRAARTGLRKVNPDKSEEANVERVPLIKDMQHLLGLSDGAATLNRVRRVLESKLQPPAPEPAEEELPPIRAPRSPDEGKATAPAPAAIGGGSPWETVLQQLEEVPQQPPTAQPPKQEQTAPKPRTRRKKRDVPTAEDWGSVFSSVRDVLQRTAQQSREQRRTPDDKQQAERVQELLDLIDRVAIQDYGTAREALLDLVRACIRMRMIAYMARVASGARQALQRQKSTGMGEWGGVAKGNAEWAEIVALWAALWRAARYGDESIPATSLARDVVNAVLGRLKRSNVDIETFAAISDLPPAYLLRLLEIFFPDTVQWRRKRRAASQSRVKVAQSEGAADADGDDTEDKGDASQTRVQVPVPQEILERVRRAAARQSLSRSEFRQILLQELAQRADIRSVTENFLMTLPRPETLTRKRVLDTSLEERSEESDIHTRGKQITRDFQDGDVGGAIVHTLMPWSGAGQDEDFLRWLFTVARQMYSDMLLPARKDSQTTKKFDWQAIAAGRSPLFAKGVQFTYLTSLLRALYALHTALSPQYDGNPPVGVDPDEGTPAQRVARALEQVVNRRREIEQHIRQLMAAGQLQLPGRKPTTLSALVGQYKAQAAQDVEAAFKWLQQVFSAQKDMKEKGQQQSGDIEVDYRAVAGPIFADLAADVIPLLVKDRQLATDLAERLHSRFKRRSETPSAFAQRVIVDVLRRGADALPELRSMAEEGARAMKVLRQWAASAPDRKVATQRKKIIDDMWIEAVRTAILALSGASGTVKRPFHTRQVYQELASHTMEQIDATTLMGAAPEGGEEGTGGRSVLERGEDQSEYSVPTEPDPLQRIMRRADYERVRELLLEAIEQSSPDEEPRFALAVTLTGDVGGPLTRRVAPRRLQKIRSMIEANRPYVSVLLQTLQQKLQEMVSVISANAQLFGQASGQVRGAQWQEVMETIARLNFLVDVYDAIGPDRALPAYEQVYQQRQQLEPEAAHDAGQREVWAAVVQRIVRAAAGSDEEAAAADAAAEGSDTVELGDEPIGAQVGSESPAVAAEEGAEEAVGTTAPPAEEGEQSVPGGAEPQPGRIRIEWKKYNMAFDTDAPVLVNNPEAAESILDRAEALLREVLDVAAGATDQHSWVIDTYMPSVRRLLKTSGVLAAYKVEIGGGSAPPSAYLTFIATLPPDLRLRVEPGVDRPAYREVAYGIGAAARMLRGESNPPEWQGLNEERKQQLSTSLDTASQRSILAELGRRIATGQITEPTDAVQLVQLYATEVGGPNVARVIADKVLVLPSVPERIANYFAAVKSVNEQLRVAATLALQEIDEILEAVEQRPGRLTRAQQGLYLAVRKAVDLLKSSEAQSRGIIDILALLLGGRDLARELAQLMQVPWPEPERAEQPAE